MKYVSITFDDGRANNYEEAFPIMKTYNMTGTIYCTTGYIDRSWKPEPTKWKSAGEPISITQMHELQEAGWELGLHGDKHITDVNDSYISLKKMNEWGFYSKSYGFSMPDSVSEEGKYKDYVKTYLGKEILYIRKGRRTNTEKLSNKILFAGYSIMGFQTAYNLFNEPNILNVRRIDTENVFTVVIRSEDKPQMIIRFLKQLPDDAWIVFMFHSILPETHPLFGTDSWFWSKERFNSYCMELNNMVREGKICVKTVYDVISNS